MGFVHGTPHHKDLTCVIYRMRFNEYCAESRRSCAVQISHPRFSCPYKGAISRRACRTPNHSPHVVDPKRSAGVTAREHPKILHSSCLSPQKSAHAAWTFRISNDIPIIIDCASLTRRISRQRPKIAHIAGFRPQDGTVADRASGRTGNLVRIVNVTGAALVPTRQNAEIVHPLVSRPKDSLRSILARRVTDRVAVCIDAEGLSTAVARQQRKLPKFALRCPDKWNYRLSSIRVSSDFSRIVDTRSGTIFAAVKLTQMLWVAMVAAVPDDS